MKCVKVDLDNLLELEARATPGNWYSTADDLGFMENDPSETYWTVGPRADSTNWTNDSNQPGYGLEKRDTDLIAAMRNSIKALCEELRAARDAIKTVEWVALGPPDNHGEDCDYWDWDEEKPSGKECECGFKDYRDAIQKYLEVVK